MNTLEEFAEMAQSLDAEPDVEETLGGIIGYARDCLDCEHAGIHLLVGGKVTTAGATDEVIREADRLQEELGEGPCLQAVWDKRTFVVDDTAADERWPEFGPEAARLGLHSMLSVQLRVEEGTFGALNFYCENRREFSDEDVATAHVFAQHASVALANARRQENLQLAVDARHLIGQAQGILMERFSIDADRAFQVLRRYSQANNVKLRDVAQRLVDTRRLPGIDQGSS